MAAVKSITVSILNIVRDCPKRASKNPLFGKIQALDANTAGTNNAVGSRVCGTGTDQSVVTAENCRSRQFVGRLDSVFELQKRLVGGRLRNFGAAFAPQLLAPGAAPKFVHHRVRCTVHAFESHNASLAALITTDGQRPGIVGEILTSGDDVPVRLTNAR